MLHAAIFAAAVPCEVPNRPATVLRAAAADEPPMAQQQGIGGTVVVLVTLAPGGTVTDARISSSPSALLNASALAAARASTFQGAIRDCVPVGATYSLSVTYDGGLLRRIQVTSKGETEALIEARGQVLRPADGAVLEFAVVTSGAVVAKVSAENAAAVERFAGDAKSVDGVREVRTSALRTGSARPDPSDEVYAARVVSVSVARAQDVQRITQALARKDVTLLLPVAWTLDDEQAAEKEAAANALRDAQRQAESLAKERGLRLVRLRDVKTERPRWERFGSPFSTVEGRPDVQVLVTVTATYLLGAQ